MKFLRKHPVLTVLCLLLLGLLFWTLWRNTALKTTHYRIPSEQLPQSFDGYRIAQVSDLHNAQFGSGNEELLDLLETAQPDLIAITGDLLDSRKTDPEVAAAFAREAVTIAPVCYIPGNHEARLPEEYADLKIALTELGVTVLENETLLLGDGVTLVGLIDPDFDIPWPEIPADTYRIVLSHRPEQMEQYIKLGFDLVLTGHAHGGQFRLPFIGGLFAPQQGFLPAFASGVHTAGSTTMIVSRGLGNSLFPLRFNNRPEIVIITLESI